MTAPYERLIGGRVVDVLTTASAEKLRGFDRFACWLNGWLPYGWRLGTVNGKWRFFRAWR